MIRELAAALVASIIFASSAVRGAEDRREQVLRDRAEISTNENWIYNNLNEGFDEAKRTGKPLLIVLRCIP